MNTEIMLKKAAICASLVFSQAAFAGKAVADDTVLDQGDMDRMDKVCAYVDTHENAAPCLEAFYRAGMAKTADVLSVLKEQGITEGQIKDFDPIACLDDTVPSFTTATSPEEYLRRPQFCLTAVGETADRNNVSYDFDGTEYLIARMQRLRHLDLN